MGIVYCGPYADQLDDHEGYAARRLPDGRLTGTWTAATAAFTGYVAACGCGWTGRVDYPPTDAGELLAEQGWDTDHLGPLIDRAAREGWPAWARRVADRAATVAAHVAAGRFTTAEMVIDRLAVDVALWARTARQLADQYSAGGGEQ